MREDRASIFVSKVARKRIKVLAAKLGYPSMVSFLEALSKCNHTDLKTIKNKPRVTI